MAIKESTGIVENNDLDEAAGAETLKPGAGSGGGDVNKTQLMASAVAAMGGMSKEEINKFAEVLATFGKNKAPGAEDKSAANKATIATKASAASKGAMQEDIEEMFAGDDLTEDFKEKASTLFEAAVNARVGMEAARLEEEFDAAVEEVAAELEEALSSKLDSYLDYVAEQWFEENRLAVESATKVEAADKFIEGIKGLFSEHFVEIPEETVDVVESLEARVAELEDKLNEEIDEKIGLKKLVEEAEKEAIFDEVAEGLAATQVEKLRTLAEGLEFSDVENFRKKVELVKENYFSGKKTTSTNVITEETTADSLEDLVEDSTVTNIDSTMSKYVSQISKSAKN